MIEVLHGNSLEVLKGYSDNYFDSVITDPPYGISFMGKKWDYQIPSVEIWREVLRVLKPGGHMLAACGTRTQHRMVVNIEDAGFEIRDVITWHYGSGFPKSMDISKAIDKSLGQERAIIGTRKHPTLKDTSKIEQKANAAHGNNSWSREWDISTPSSIEGKEWDGWGTALKPATEFFTLARKPLAEKTISKNILLHRIGGININDCRISTDEHISNHSRSSDAAISKGKYGDSSEQETHQTEDQKLGRFPANVIFDPFTAKLLNDQSGNLKSGDNCIRTKPGDGYHGGFGKEGDEQVSYDDSGGASRFFYCAKPSQAERNLGLENFEYKLVAAGNQAQAELKRGNVDFTSDSDSQISFSNIKKRKNHHPTVKPIKLMQYLVRLITPKGGIVLDPFNGSGTTGIACSLEGFNYIGIELDEEYCKISRARIDAWQKDKTENNQSQLELF